MNFPLTNAQLTDFFLQHEYASYFTLQQALGELKDSRIHSRQSPPTAPPAHEITREGEETLTFFENNISPAIIEDMDTYLKENRLRLRNEVSLVSDYYKSTSQDYIVHCEVREGRSPLIELNLSVPDREQAAAMSSRWEHKSKDIYSFIMKSLMSERRPDRSPLLCFLF